jgi:hypothetical protein
VTDKKTIELIQDIASKVSELQLSDARNSLKINFVVWILGAILLTILPAFGFLIAFWVQHNG